MVTVGIREVNDGVSAVLAAAQGEKVLVTRHGRPYAIVIGVDGMDAEDIYWGLNEKLHRDIGRSRRENDTVSFEEAERFLDEVDAEEQRQGRHVGNRRLGSE